MVKHGQIFSPETQAVFYNWKQKPIQRMLDFDFLCGERDEHRTNGYKFSTGLSSVASTCRLCADLAPRLIISKIQYSTETNRHAKRALLQVGVCLQLPASFNLDLRVAFKSCFLGPKK